MPLKPLGGYPRYDPLECKIVGCDDPTNVIDETYRVWDVPVPLCKAHRKERGV